MRFSMQQKPIAIAAGIAVAATVGLGAGALIWRDGSPAGQENKTEEHSEEGHEEGEVAEGDMVALSPEEAAAAGIEVTSVGRGGGAELVIPGRVVFAPGAEASVGSPVQGVVERVFVGAGGTVSAGSPIAVVRSSDAAALTAAADSARADVEAARAAFRREDRLHRERITARQDLEAARAAMLRAEAALRAAQGQLSALGSPSGAGRVTVRAPFSGTVTAVAASPGAVLAQGGAVAQIADQGRVEIVFDAPAAQASLIRAGTPIFATIAGGQEIRATVTAISPNPANASAQIRASTTGFIPPVGTPVSGRVLTRGSSALIVPSDAVQSVEGRPVVFVVERGGFRAIPVVVGRMAGGRTEILRGLEGDERIAGRGAFLLKAELSRGEAEHGH
jgi:membrane fusion protein, heavy metal efflux system